MGLYDITLLWADKSVILFSLTGIKGISKTDYICCDFKKVWEMTGKIFTQPIPQGKKLFKRITQCHLFGALKHTFSFFFFSPTLWKIYDITPVKTPRVRVRCWSWMSIKTGELGLQPSFADQCERKSWTWKTSELFNESVDLCWFCRSISYCESPIASWGKDS